MRENIIEHEGVVCDLSQKGMRVKVLSKGACEGCRAQGLCMGADTRERFIEVGRENFEEGEEFNIGDTVLVTMSESLGMRAVGLMYAVPALLIVAFLLYSQYAGAGELVAGLIALGAVVVYFLILYLLREKIGRHFVFTVRKFNQINKDLNPNG